MKDKLVKKEDWRNRLMAFIEERRATPFSWEDGNDCCKWTADAVKAMTGQDPMKGMRNYRSEEGGKAVLKDKGFKSHVDFLEKLFEEVKPVTMAMPGDISVDERGGLGIIQGQFIYQPGPSGVSLASFGSAVRAFRIPEEIK